MYWWSARRALPGPGGETRDWRGEDGEMEKRRSVLALRQMRTLFDVGAVGGLSDAHLLDQFSTGHREAAEAAFATLVERHGPMVLRVCGACWATRTTSTTPSRPRSWCSCGRPGRSGCATRLAPGCMAWPSGSRPRRRWPRRGARRTSAGVPRSLTWAGRRGASPTTSPRLSTTRSNGCPRSTARRSCSATSRACPTRRPRRPWDGRSGQCAAGCTGP